MQPPKLQGTLCGAPNMKNASKKRLKLGSRQSGKTT